ncbi:MAG: DUF1343 domain-containing protein [Bacteroidota bacterium]
MNRLFQLLDHVSRLILISAVGVLLFSCSDKNRAVDKVGVLSSEMEKVTDIIPAAENVAEYYELLQGKRVAMVVNQTSQIGSKHLVDSLLDLKVDIVKIFAPEHGFRGDADAGEVIKDGRDIKSGLPVVSLYGKKKKPTAEDLIGIEVIVFDIQDVGARFYTYISSLHYVMEACAENGVQLVVLDRPNPNAHYIDGPVLENEFTSFVGMHPVPVVYGMTIGEYAQMINGEGWLKDGITTDLKVIHNRNYSHDSYYELPIKPSPNLPNFQSILLYPSLCFFEGTQISVGRGTNSQFQILGHPKYVNGDFSFTPKSMQGAKYPKHENKLCQGVNLQHLTTGGLFDLKRLDLSYLINAYSVLSDQNEEFFLNNNFFEKLAGTQSLRKQIKEEWTEEQIRESWREGLEQFKLKRTKYLIYD